MIGSATMPSTPPVLNARTESITLSKSTRSIEPTDTGSLQVDIFINHRDAALLSLVDVGIYFCCRWEQSLRPDKEYKDHLQENGHLHLGRTVFGMGIHRLARRLTRLYLTRELTVTKPNMNTKTLFKIQCPIFDDPRNCPSSSMNESRRIMVGQDNKVTVGWFPNPSPI
ncbi:hypothetical protein O9992_30775 [Vibrio lentus]|nr:hypothetical protein [Vibrio lentus]